MEEQGSWGRDPRIARKYADTKIIDYYAFPASRCHLLPAPSVQPAVAGDVLGDLLHVGRGLYVVNLLHEKIGVTARGLRPALRRTRSGVVGGQRLHGIAVEEAHLLGQILRAKLQAHRRAEQVLRLKIPNA